MERDNAAVHSNPQVRQNLEQRETREEKEKLTSKCHLMETYVISIEVIKEGT